MPRCLRPWRSVLVNRARTSSLSTFPPPARPTTWKGTPGVFDAKCSIAFGDASVTDSTPVTVSLIQILELDQEFQIIAQDIRVNQTLVNGDTFTYTSVALTTADVFIPKALQVVLFAQNALGEDLVNALFIGYDSSECSVAPILSFGQRIGWVYFVLISCNISINPIMNQWSHLCLASVTGCRVCLATQALSSVRQ